MVTRYKLILTLILVSFFTIISTAQENSGKSSGDPIRPKKIKPFAFIQLSDPQMGMEANNSNYEFEKNRLDSAVLVVNRIKPRFVVVTGDMVNDPQNKDQITEYKRLIGKISHGIPVYTIPGNHDINPSSGANLQQYLDNYGSDRFSFIYRNTLFVGINSNLIKQNDPGLEQEQFEWLKLRLTEGRHCRYKFVFTHCPVFVRSMDEKESYSNWPLELRIKYMDLFAQFGVNVLFAGHLHQNAYGKERGIEMVTIGSIGKSLGKGFPGMNLVKIYSDKYIYEYIPLNKFPQKMTF